MSNEFEEQTFGQELRRLRTAKGMTLQEFAAQAHYSKGYLSKIEAGVKQPSVQVARRCDAVLGAEGRLAALVEGHIALVVREDGSAPAAGRTGIVKSHSGGRFEFPSFASGALRTATPAAFVGRAVAPSAAVFDDASEPVAGFRRIFHEYRALGQRLSPRLVAHLLIETLDSVLELADCTRGSDRSATLCLAARYAEYAGWMTQEMGDDQAALFWTGRCVDLADAAGEVDLIAYTWVRRAGISMYREDAASTVELARRAQEECSDPNTRALALQREAQGHALAGDERACMRALEQATDLESRMGVRGDPPLGPTAMRRPVEFATGWCLHDLGRSAQAAEVLAAQLPLIDPKAVRARARCASRLALAYAACGEVDEACATIEPVLDTARQVDSATLRAELRTLRREFSRLRRSPHVTRLAPRLTQALQTSV